MAQMRLTAVYMKVPEGYIAFVEELPGSNTQGETLEEARANLEEAVAMVLEANRELSEESLGGRRCHYGRPSSCPRRGASRSHPPSGARRLRVSPSGRQPPDLGKPKG